MKKSNLVKISAIVLVLSILSTLAISGTIAKYTSTVAGTDSAKVASFDFNVYGNKTKFTTQTAEINIFDTVDDENTRDGFIAPGTTGSLLLYFGGSKAEVPIEYTIDTLGYENNSNIPLIFEYQGKYYSDVYNDIAIEVEAATVTAMNSFVTELRRMIATGVFGGGILGNLANNLARAAANAIQAQIDTGNYEDISDKLDDAVTLVNGYGVDTDSLTDIINSVAGIDDYSFLLSSTDTDKITLTGNMEELLEAMNEYQIWTAPNSAISIAPLNWAWAWESYIEGEDGNLDSADTILGKTSTTGTPVTATMTIEVTAVQLDEEPTPPSAHT